MSKLQTIKLGDREFTVQRPTLGRLRNIIDALDNMVGKSGGDLIDGAVGVLVAGLYSTHPDITADALLDITATAEELNEAVSVMLRIAGLRQAEDGSGEAEPQLAAA